MFVLLIIAASMALVQLIAGVWGLIYQSTEFKVYRNRYQNAIESETAGTYYRGYSSSECLRRMTDHSTNARRFGLLAATAPFSAVLVPAAMLGCAGYGIKKGVESTIPALTYKGE